MIRIQSLIVTGTIENGSKVFFSILNVLNRYKLYLQEHITDFDIFHRMAALRMLYSLTFTNFQGRKCEMLISWKR